MSPASYRAAPPRVAFTTLAHACRQLQNAPAQTHPGGFPDRPGPETRTRAYPDGLGDGDPPGEADDDPEGDGTAATAWAFWYSSTASLSAWSAWPYLVKSPACWAALRSLSALLIFSTAAAVAALFGVPGVVVPVVGGGVVVPVGCPPAAVSRFFSAPGRVSLKPTYWPKLTSTYFSCGYELGVLLCTYSGST